MAFTDTLVCDRCKKEIKGNSILVDFGSQPGLPDFKDGLDLCSDCFAAFLNWFKNPEPVKLGPVERVAKREDSDLRELGPVERVARRIDDK